MLGRFMDWLDEITAYDRTAVRVILLIVALNVLLASWAVYDTWLKPEACDKTCQRAVDQFISDNPQLFEPMPTVDTDEIIREVIEQSPR